MKNKTEKYKKHAHRGSFSRTMGVIDANITQGR
jgi:hypothetical protein